MQYSTKPPHTLRNQFLEAVKAQLPVCGITNAEVLPFAPCCFKARLRYKMPDSSLIEVCFAEPWHKIKLGEMDAEVARIIGEIQQHNEFNTLNGQLPA